MKTAFLANTGQVLRKAEYCFGTIFFFTLLLLIGCAHAMPDASQTDASGATDIKQASCISSIGEHKSFEIDASIGYISCLHQVDGILESRDGCSGYKENESVCVLCTNEHVVCPESTSELGEDKNNNCTYFITTKIKDQECKENRFCKHLLSVE